MTAIPLERLVEQYEREKSVRDARRLRFLGVDGYDVYNITPDFVWEGRHWIAGRVERRENERSCVRLFERTQQEDAYEATLPELTFENFQDPFVARVGEELILGGVQIICDPLDAQRIFSWHTLFYRGKRLEDLRLFAKGPAHMKDIRLVEQRDGRIGVFTRPQGLVGGLGRIGYLSLSSLDDLNGETLAQARVYDTHFLPTEWGGVNQAHALPDGRLGVVGHIARRGADGLHYHAMSFVFDPAKGTHTPVRLLARREDLYRGEACKRPDLKDVLFTGGLVRMGDGSATLYAGVSDCLACRATVDDPFWAWEG
jgi:hypothetical protein